jgi:hypothetical protein
MEDIFTLVVPFHVAEVGAVVDSESTQVFEDSGVDVFCHGLEVVNIGAMIDFEDFIKVASVLLGEVEGVNLWVDEDAGCQPVGCEEESIVFHSFGTRLEVRVNICSFSRRKVSIPGSK